MGDVNVNRRNGATPASHRGAIGCGGGSQPFGGEGRSGTGFKAGGPHYLLRFVHEQTVSTDTTSAGGNASLLSIEDVGTI